MNEVKVIEFAKAIENIRHCKASSQYFAMYSSWFNGIVKDPRLMMVPVDDHMVHRGDGVFEAFKSVHRHIYLLNDHLDRLQASADKISLKLPMSRTELVDIIKTTARAAGKDDLLFRLYLARGPGGFSANPYDSEKQQIYLVACQYYSPPQAWFDSGVRLKKSQIPIKEPLFATVKSCNYLPNVLMRKEAADWGVEFTLNFNAQGFMGEGSTENVMIVTEKGDLVFPRLETILRGTTMLRLRSLGETILEDGLIRGIEERDIHESEIPKAREILMVGTTLDVIGVTEYNDKKIGDGGVGQVAKRCLKLIRQDQEHPHDRSGLF